MEERIDAYAKRPEAMKAIYAMEMYLAKSSLDKQLLHLIKYRVSQINGCAYCLDMHSKDLRAGGETEQRLYTLDAWRETPFFTDRERAALEWAEAVTLVSETHVPDEVYEAVRKEFSEDELIDLTLAVATINTWNRMAISFRTTPGTYQPGQHSTAA